MPFDTPPVSKGAFWTGWVLSGLVTLMLSLGVVQSFLRTPQVIEGFTKFGYPESLLLPIAIIELLCAVIYLIPRTSVLGAILLTGYMGGAVATHLRIGDPLYVVPIIVGVVVWGALFLRDTRLRALIPLRSSQ